MKIAIVALTRGYPDDQTLYDDLIVRNKSIYKFINKEREIPAEIILFHEGNINLKDQEYISSNSPEEIKFIDVSRYFKDIFIDLKEEKKFNLGYRYMCRFNMYHLWSEVEDYDYILRVDEDIEILEFDPYIFEFMKSKDISFMTGRFSKEIHKLTNSTLPPFLSEVIGLNTKKIYNHKFPYTNLYATSVKFWKNKEVNEYLSRIAMSESQIAYRWGDIPVLGGMLNYKYEKIKLFPKLKYKHISHNMVIHNNFFRNIFVNSKYNPISIKEGVLIKFKLKIKAKIKKI